LIQRERVRPLNNEAERDRDFVLYWMQAAQRAEDNHALEFAIDRANARQKPLIIFFGLTESFPEANERHYAFMLEGLAETSRTLQKRGIQLVVRRISPEAGAIELARRADLVVVDRGYLRIERGWRESVGGEVDCPLIQVETNAVVPLEQASPREEWAARTIRPKIKRQLAEYLVPLRARRMKKDSLGLNFDSLNVSEAGRALGQLDIDRSVGRVSAYTGGTGEAKRRLAEFIAKKLLVYPEMRNDPNADAVSHLSPYLHFGQISPLYIALEVLKSRDKAADVYLEELIVRRELGLNFVQFNPDYDRFAGLPPWAQKTLEEHAKDRREAIYSPDELEGARTGDPCWNAAQQEMLLTGKMHNYMRMYWGKKIIEWTVSPDEAFRLALYLNNKYEIDGRDPNSFAGVAWCFGKHDRAWPSRPVFGKVRSMTAAGLRRKFDVGAYIRKYEVSHGAIR
jgi:deoxyribodipyrimidine photo-lyase